jgi:hypothetical protein
MRGTLGEWLDLLVAEPMEDWIPIWPPDAFAISAAFLRRTGGYVSLVNGAHSKTWAPKTAERSPEKVGLEWRRTLSAGGLTGKTPKPLRQVCPIEIRRWWKQLRSRDHLSFVQAAAEPDLIAAACKLCIASDAASAGIGIVLGDGRDDEFLKMAETLLTEHNDCRSFCRFIRPDVLAVLGKQHTPQRGCTIRSLTHHLALHSATEISAFWSGPYKAASEDMDVLNLLLLPWPTTVDPDDFHAATTRDGKHMPVPSSPAQRYFDYAPRRSASQRAITAAVRRALKRARSHADRIHGIVFPEMALTQRQFVAVERVAVSERAMLVAGVRAPGEPSSNGMPLNLCAVQPLGLTGVDDSVLKRPTAAWDETRRVQLKHHRWCLDRDQIIQYNLGGRLPASRDCWERVFIGDRDVHFVTLSAWLTFCVLICEDLARQDPMAEVIRAVGPNLVFALLMDGPQLKQRWPARYASVLAEDPGSSVLTLTSLGMAKRSCPKEGEPAVPSGDKTVIGLWRDAIFGQREIAVEDGHDACVLSLVCRSTREYTIDGRNDNEQAHFPVFAGAYSFKA